MKLKSFSPETLGSIRVGHPLINMNADTGVITLNATAATTIGLASYDCVLFHQDEETPGDWFIEKVKDEGFKLRSKDGKSLTFNSTALVRQIFASVGCEKKYGTISPASEPVSYEKKRKLWPLITAKLVS